MSFPAPIEPFILQARTIAVVGLSSNPVRPSYGVARYLQQQGYRIVPVNPKETVVLGEPAFADLEQAQAAGPIDIVCVFRRSEHVPAIARTAARIGAGMLWLQEGVAHPAAEAEARAAGLLVVADHCLLKAHIRLRARQQTPEAAAGKASR
ncbi:MAG TPA: CoA-binding protein [Terriglobales bacterium]|jgi:predicted CoA-binding protein